MSELAQQALQAMQTLITENQELRDENFRLEEELRFLDSKTKNRFYQAVKDMFVAFMEDQEGCEALDMQELESLEEEISNLAGRLTSFRESVQNMKERNTSLSDEKEFQRTFDRMWEAMTIHDEEPPAFQQKKQEPVVDLTKPPVRTANVIRRSDKDGNPTIIKCLFCKDIFEVKGPTVCDMCRMEPNGKMVMYDQDGTLISCVDNRALGRSV